MMYECGATNGEETSAVLFELDLASVIPIDEVLLMDAIAGYLETIAGVTGVSRVKYVQVAEVI